MNRQQKGLLGELNAQSYFIVEGYEVYSPINDNAKYDMIVVKDESIIRVSVKTTSMQQPNGKWRVELRNMSRRNNSEVVISYFNATKADILVVYIIPENRLVLIDATKITSNNTLFVS